MKKDNLVFIKHMLDNVNSMIAFSRGVSKKGLISNKQKQYAIVRAIELIGESAKNLPKSFILKYPKTSWKEIIGTRDKLIHHYFGIDLDEIWKIVNEDILELKKQLEVILSSEESKQNKK